MSRGKKGAAGCWTSPDLFRCSEHHFQGWRRQDQAQGKRNKQKQVVGSALKDGR